MFVFVLLPQLVFIRISVDGFASLSPSNAIYHSPTLECLGTPGT